MILKKSCVFTVFVTIFCGILLEGINISIYAQSPAGEAPSSGSREGIADFVQDEIIIKVRSDTTGDQIHTIDKTPGIDVLDVIPKTGTYRLKVSNSVQDAIASTMSQPFIENARPNYVMANLDGDIITLFDMEAAIEQVPAFLRQHYTSKEGKESLLNSLTDYKLLARSARENRLEQLPEIKNKINTIVERSLAQAYLEKLAETITVSDEELKNYYEAHMEEFQIPEQVKVRHIVVKTEEEARGILEAIKAGAEFEKLAQEKSIDITAKNGGEIGWIGRGRMVPEFEKAAFELASGEFSGAVKTISGYHIIKLDDKRAAKQQGISEVSNKIKEILQEKKRKENIETKKEELRKKYKATLHTGYLSEVRINTEAEVNPQELFNAIENIFKKPY